MPILKSVRDERFAQYVASGVSQSEAYRRVSGCQGVREKAFRNLPTGGATEMVKHS